MTCGAILPTPLLDGAADRCAGTEKAAAGLHSIVEPTGAGRSSGQLPELSENEIQRCVFQHLRTRGAPGIFAFHPKNASADMAGRKRGIHVGLGVEPGIPDVIVIKHPDRCYCSDSGCAFVYALELKRESRRGRIMTKHEAKQKATRERMAQCGVTIGHAYGLDEALAFLERHGLLVGKAA